MIYRWPRQYEEHWFSLHKMIESNYAHAVRDDAYMIFANYLRTPCHELKREYNCNHLIVYQTEPLVPNHWWKTEKILENLDGADEVWDYDFENIQILKNHGINAKFKPPRYTESLKSVENSEEPDIDMLFYGSLTPRRLSIFSHLFNDTIIRPEDYEIFIKFKFVTTYNVFSEELDKLIGRSKIILNLNPYDGESRQQQTRIYYALNNNKCVLSEKNKFNYFGNLISEFNGKDDLYNQIMYLLRDDKWKEYTNKDYKQFSDSQVIENPYQ